MLVAKALYVTGRKSPELRPGKPRATCLQLSLQGR